MECLNKIIGITNSPCECVDEGLVLNEPASIRESVSGLYLDDLEGGINTASVKGIDTCLNLSEIALGARRSAIKKLSADISVALSLKYKTGKAMFRGNIGRPSYVSTLAVSKQYQFLKLRPIEGSDAIIKLTGFRIIVDRVAELNVKIIKALRDSDQGEVIHESTVTSGANTYTQVIMAPNFLELPLTENGETMDYYFVWEGGEAKPKDIKASCGCRGLSYKEYLEASGGELSDLNLLTAGTKTEFTRGISLDVEISCKPGNLICREYDRENAVAVTMAWAVMYKAGELLIEGVLNSGEVNRYTMMNREYLWGKRNHFRKEYDVRIQYLASVIDVSSSDCFVCRENKMFIAGIMS